MDVFDVFLQIGLVTGIFVVYLIFFRNKPRTKGNYAVHGWNYYLKLPCAYLFVKRWKKERSRISIDEKPLRKLLAHRDEISFRTAAPDGSAVVVNIRRLPGRQDLTEVTVYIKLPDGTQLVLPCHPDTVIGVWQDSSDGWRAGGLTLQVVEPYKILRLLFDEELKRVSDGVRVHVKFNLMWSSSSRLMQYPADWSDILIARALAYEPWHDTNWQDAMKKCNDESYHQFGAMQGRIQVRSDTELEHDLYIRTRGIRERRITKELARRSLTLTAVASDGTAIELQAFSHSGTMTKYFAGTIRLPNYNSYPITWTDLILSDFCETPGALPKAYTINVGGSNSHLKVVIRISDDGCNLLSGSPYQQQSVLRTVSVNIDNYRGAGVLFLNYQAKEKVSPSVYIRPKPLLRWLNDEEVGPVSYCAEFESPVAKCPNIVGGKGASLGLLASMQLEEGYKVPPGFCVTYLALDKHLEGNPQIVDAIKDLQASTLNYEEKEFKTKCENVVKLFSESEIIGDVKNEILSNLDTLENSAHNTHYGSEIVYAVRSSAVGEDSEALSAAGQNSTILGCHKNNVVSAVRDCWASMYSFHSVFYRRRNGQACQCRGSVTVQILVAADTAGVMFTRHERPGRITIAANLGLGESVVSGSAEPDSIIVRNIDNDLKIERIDIGGKAQRVMTSQNGVQTLDVPLEERNKVCLTESQILRLARLGAVQEKLWGAHRDIEWVFRGSDLYLLQARPITSLERWTEEELLHELDLPIMSDDELLTFANTGEVFPKPITALSYDLVVKPLEYGMNQPTGVQKEQNFVGSITLTHNRVCLPLYNSLYRIVPKKIDLNIRIMEMAIHGKPMAGDKILQVAKHRNKPRLINRLQFMKNTFQSMILSNRYAKKSIVRTNSIKIKAEGDYLPVVLERILESDEATMDICFCHALCTTASVASQIIALNIFLEGKEDFSPEKCSEISSILSSGDVISAEVPKALDDITRKLEASGKFDEFKKQEPTRGLDWLKEHVTDVRKDVDKFLDIHGHRAIMEFDLSTKPWCLIPENMITVLQNMTVIADKEQYRSPAADIGTILKSLTSDTTKKILSWVLPMCQRMVGNRETTKSQLILAIHKRRLALRKLAMDMVKQWYLPDPELIFHFRLAELREYLTTRDPAILRKASQRSQYYSSWAKLKFAEMQEGWPAPVPQKTIEYNPDACVRGTGVCGHEVVARAAVLTDLSDIGMLQQGDILITRSTDIGWSPYFPLLSGVVTELGGLISHGAVIAREYGLPCVVGATGATDVFTTGDTIRISPTKGTIERVRLVPSGAEDNQ